MINFSRWLPAISNQQKSSFIYLIKWILLALTAGVIGPLLVFVFSRQLYFLHDIYKQLSIPFFLWPPTGALITGLLVYRFCPGSAGEGLPAYIRSQKFYGRFSFKETVFKYFAAALTLGSLGSGGLVGPLGRINAGIMSFLARFISKVKLGRDDYRTAGMCGLAAVVGSIFHSSIGGGIFAVEIIQRQNMSYRHLFPAILASSSAVFLCKIMGWENFYEFDVINRFFDTRDFGWIVLCALLCALLGRFFLWFYPLIARIFKRDSRRYIALKVFAGSLIASLIALLVNPEILGTSKSLMISAVQGDLSILYGNFPLFVPAVIVLLILLLAKCSAVCFTVGPGMSAGLTGPTILLGLLLGNIVALLAGIQAGTPSFYALLCVGFSGILAGSMNIPLAAAVMGIEIFGLQYSFPAGLSAIICFQFNRMHTIYQLAVDQHQKTEKKREVYPY